MNRQIKAVLIDLSGTLHIDNLAISGAQEALSRLRNTDTKIKFVTNTTKESKNVLYNRLKNLGFDIKKEEIFSSLAAARQIIINRSLNPCLLIDSAAMEDFDDLIKSSEKQDSVVIGLAPEKFNYDDLNNAFRLILNGASLIAIHEGRYYKRPDGLSLGPGAFVKGLEYATNIKAEVIGKPTAEFFRAALQDILPEEAIMIGDDVKDDIAGAQSVGIKGILVQTGKYRPGDENTITPPPTKVCKSFVEAVDVILKNL
ncbi:haloacid dehalogenase-like hydrolase domain-containing protein 2 [Leptopilina boulardi]|uniref:haloacid dehalogenase-like hydrolase domain-containing protein 2 n=1 Tax=Leptopilina boulardi TaxID=63433 RepID=UPI0021F57130|nr:haloacid dehalogenase-like hydrolase domain-containing protein 2 [Leptopilina boulardi]